MRILLPLIIAFGALLTFAQAKIIGGVALSVNGKAITMHEIDSVVKARKVGRQQAIDALIDDRLRQDEIERMGIAVDDFRVDDEMERIAQNNGITKDALIASLRREGVGLSAYRDELKRQIETTELMQRVLAQGVGVLDQKELAKYYEKYKKEFVLPSRAVVTRYLASDAALLKDAQLRPNAVLKGVERLNETLVIKDLPPQIAQIFYTAKPGAFTPVLNSGNGSFIIFRIKELQDFRQLSFEESRAAIQQRMLADKEQSVLKDYFIKLRDKANIEYIR